MSSDSSIQVLYVYSNSIIHFRDICLMSFFFENVWNHVVGPISFLARWSWKEAVADDKPEMRAFQYLW